MERIGLEFERTWVGEWNEPLPGWEQGEVAYGLTRAGVARASVTK